MGKTYFNDIWLINKDQLKIFKLLGKRLIDVEK